MKHLKLTFVGLLALTAAASDAFAQGPPGPRRGPRREARQWEARQWEACRRSVVAYRVCRAVAHPVSRWPVARWAAVSRAVAHRVSRAAADPAAIS